MNTSETWQPTVVDPGTSGAGPGLGGLRRFLETTDVAEFLLKAKAVVFRGFGVDRESHGAVADVLLPNRLAYVHGNSPRTKVGDNLYTSTEYPAEYEISMHNEMSYSNTWPTRILFHCERAPDSGGATPVVDGHLWLESLDAEVREALAPGVRYTQNLHGGRGFGRSWQETFETEDRDAVEEFLWNARAEWSWRANGSLRVSQLRQATVRHPVTGVEVWFNQVDQWHPAGLGEDAAVLVDLMPEDELPQNVTLADGGPVPAEYAVHVRETGMALAVDVDWRAGDLLLADNVAVAHGRRAYTGARRVLVAMSDHPFVSGP